MIGYGTPQPNYRPADSTALILTAVGSAILLLGGLLLLLLYFLSPFMLTGNSALEELGGTSLASATAQYAVLGFYGTFIGGGLLLQSIQALRGAPSRRFQPSLAWALIASVLFPLAIIVGVASLRLEDVVAGYVFPILQLLAVLLPPVIALSLLRSSSVPSAQPAPALPSIGGLTGRTNREDPQAHDLVRRVIGPISWRRVLAAIAWGLGGGTLISMILEIVGLIIFGLIGVLIFMAFNPGFDLSSLAAGGAIGENCAQLQEIMANPFVVGGMVLALGVAVPWVEEPAKSLGVVLLRRRLTAPIDALLYGPAAGVGFGMIESAVYNVADLDSWASTATLRVGTTMVHALSTGLFGLGWYYALREGDRRRFWRFAGSGVLVHGLWNAMQVVIIVVGTQRSCSTSPVAMAQAGDPAGFLLLGATVLLSLGCAVGLFLLARHFAAADAANKLGSR